MQEPDRTLQAGRRYVLGEGEDFYGIWDRRSPGKPVETFDLTDAGLTDARKRISRLAAQDFWARIGPTALRWGLFGGLAVWILTGLLLWIRLAVVLPSVGFGDFADPFLGYGEPGWVKVANVAENVAFRVWIAAGAILVALRLFGRGREPI
jgi:hypothetical protein